MKKTLSLLLSVLLLLSLGCIGGGDDEKKKNTKQFVEPCPVINTGIRIRIVGQELDTKEIKEKLASNFVNDLTAKWAQERAKETYKLECYWGKKKGQRKSFYYCEGEYMAPELTDEGVIKRQLMKQFQIGFDVEEHEVGSWSEGGKKHERESYYYLTVKDVKTRCYVSN